MTDREKFLINTARVEDLVEYIFCGVLDLEEHKMLKRERYEDYMEACSQAVELELSFEKWCGQSAEREEVEHYEM